MRGREQADESTPREKRHDCWGAVLDTLDARELARFYVELLEWEVYSEDPSFVTIAPRDGVAYIGFQTSQPQHTRSSSAPSSPSTSPREHVRVMLDPAGHPFCLYVDT
jgi:hypothetical protein